MTRTLTFKIVLAFLLVSLTVAVLGALIARLLTEVEFKRLVLDQAQNRFVNLVTDYYRVTGAWEGVLDYVHLSSLPLQPRPQLQPDLPPRQELATRSQLLFVLANREGIVVVPVPPYRLGESLPQSVLEEATPVEVGGETVGYALATGALPEMDARELRYLERTNLALAYAALGATAIALFLGFFLARNLTRPLRQLTLAIRAVSQGDLDQRVDVSSQDEIGELAGAFNQMSAGLARAHQLRRQMTADIAHDLRNPLTVIAGYVEALRDKVLQPSPERFETIFNEVQHLQRLVEDLRTLSLADAGELPLYRQSLDPQVLLERIAAVYSHSASEQGLRLQVQAAAGLPKINVDVERMVQVLNNLVSNALRYTPAGGSIHLTAAAQDGFVLLGVQDTGKGIPPEALPHIFERFYRGDTSRQRQVDETGLGLAIARSIVEAHGGTISAESELGKGTSFTIRL